MGKQGHSSAELADGMKKSESSSDRIERAADESEQDPQSVSEHENASIDGLVLPNLFVKKKGAMQELTYSP